MKTASVKGPSIISVDETEKPVLNSGDILVQMHACGICGSDLEKVFGQYGQPSMRLGHEPAGIIVDVASDVVDFKKGDRVFTHHHVSCYDCHFCNHGNETMCKKYSETNLSPCGLSEEYVVPAWNVSHGGVLKISDSLSFEEAAMIEPLACCVRAWKKCAYREGDSTAIFGVGPTGMMHVMLAQAKKFSKIFCFDVNDFRLDFAKKFNITESINSMDENRKQKILDKTDELGVDVAIVATSSLKALEDAIDGTPNIITVPPFLTRSIASSSAFILLVATIATSTPLPSVCSEIFCFLHSSIELMDSVTLNFFAKSKRKSLTSKQMIFENFCA